MNTVHVRQEDTTDTIQISPYSKTEAVNDLISVTGWTCRSVVLRKVGDPSVIINSVTKISTDLLYFEATLEPVDTAKLDTGVYLWVIEMENLTLNPKYRKEYHTNLVVSANASITSTTEVCYPIVSIGTSAKKFADKDTIVIASTTLPNSLVSVKLKDDAGYIVQTGYMSTALGATTSEILLLENVITEPTSICLVTG